MPSHHHLCTLSPLSLLLLFFFFFSGSFHGVRSAFSTICDPASSFQCGNVLIQYPFWNNSDTPVHCGYPGLGLDCPYGSDHPTLSLPGDAYFVTDINYDDKTLTLVDIDVAGQICPRARHNLTLGSLPLNYNPTNVNLTFFFDCTAPSAASIPALPIDCLRSGDNWSYVSVNWSPEEAAALDKELGCEETVVAAVKRKAVTAANAVEEFAGAMSEGFVMDWAAAKACGECEHSGGRCAFNQNDHLLCCDDGSNHTDGSFCKGRNEVCVSSSSLSWEMVRSP